MDEQKLQALLKDMTLQEKIEQLVQLDSSFFDNDGVCTGPVEKFAMTEDQPYRVGSLLGVKGAEKIIDLQGRMMARQPHHIPALFMMDVIHGYQTIFPVPLAIGSSFNPALAEQVASVAAREASATGLHVTFSPMIDLSRDSR